LERLGNEKIFVKLKKFRGICELEEILRGLKKVLNFEGVGKFGSFFAELRNLRKFEKI
jgi:hypothetical protein